jgi:hypothetical protein
LPLLDLQGCLFRPIKARLAQKAISVSNRQAQAAEQANSQAQKESESSQTERNEDRIKAEAARQLDERPWIGVVSTSQLVLEADKPAKVQLEVANSGKTVALDYGCRYAVLMRPTPFNIETYFSTREWLALKPTPNVLFPGMHAFLPIVTSASLNKVDLDRIQAKTMVTYLICDCSYRDVFKHRHRTEFCTIYDPDFKAFLSCNNHNSAS